MSADILYAVAAWTVLAALLVVGRVGKPPRPITNEVAVFAVVINFTIAILLALVGAGRIR